MKKVVLPLCLFLLFSCTSENEISTGKLKVGEMMIPYERQGNGPNLLLLHAGLQDMSMWDQQVEGLKSKFTILRFDLPGNGNVEGEDTTVLIADVIRQLLDHFGIKKTNVAGLSLGSVCATDFAIAYPQMIDKLILMAPGINGYYDNRQSDSASFAWYGEMRKYLEEKDTTNAALAFTRAWAVGPYRTLDMNDPTTKYVATTTRNTLKKHKFTGWPVLQDKPKAYEKLSSISLPVLIIHSDKDLPSINETSLYLEETIPGARRVRISDAAHMLNMEKPDEVNNYVENFILHGLRK